MSNYSNMSGLDLFTDPFSRQLQAYSQPPARSNSTVASQPKAAATQTQPDRQAANHTQPKSVAAQSQQPNTVAKSTAPQENVKTSVPVAEPVKEQEQKPVATEPAPAQEQKPTAAPAPAEAATPVDTQPEPPKKTLELDMSTGTGTSGKTPDEDDAARRKHEEAEKKRREIWESRQAEKRKAEKEALQKLQNMSDDDAIAESIKRVSEDTERLTRRNMKECVAAHIQELARKNPDFARRTMHPHKSMIRCFKYINRMARDYVKQEMEDNDIKPDGNGYGCDVPDGLCYQWAEDYFNSADVPEDKVEEEKFIPKPYVGTTTKTSSKTKKTATKAKKTEKPATKDTAKNQAPKDNFEQMSLFQEGR